MQFTIVNTHSIYQRLLDATDDTTREAIFNELIEPFEGLVKIFGWGKTGIDAFASWGMKPTQFAAENHEHMESVMKALEQANAWQRAAQSLDKGRDAFAAYADQIKLENVTFGLMLADLSHFPQAAGYTGFGGVPGWIMTVYGDPTPDNLKRIEACTVHELHHNIWSDYTKPDFMKTTTVADYMVMEGLAESFAAELYGEDTIGPWVTQFDESQLERTKIIFREGLTRTGFNTIRGYIFGGEIAESHGLEKIDVPMYAGYALGYRVVQAYLKRTGKTVADATFVPPQEIVAESCFFD
jgi:uncharacterized protein YjaZ